MPFADELIGPHTAQLLARAIEASGGGGRLAGVRAAASAFPSLSLRERSDLLRDALLQDLPGDYDSFAGRIRAARDGRLPFTGWLIWPVTTALAVKAIDEGTDEAFDDALAMLAGLTSRLTAEFAIRSLLEHNLERALAAILHWTEDDAPDVRRLASEGTRPFLPWARRVRGILADPRCTLPIISALYRDESEYVRRSVANHLNDLSRHHPELVVQTATAWLAAPDENTTRVVRHGLRTLVKKGDPAALALMGFTAAAVEVTGPRLAATTVPFGGSVSFTATITNTGAEPARLAVDYVVHHRKADGGQTGKTFKLTTRTLAPGEKLEISREHSFRAITTRRYYSGGHSIELQVNGTRSGRTDFTLLAADESPA
jgi:3-methyladenine DNA glycosylase AlkC